MDSKNLSSEITVTSWNLGWHVSLAEAQTWITACSNKFAFDTSKQRWTTSANGSKTGWELRWERREAIDWDMTQLPPCNVYQDNSRTIPVTITAYQKRVEQLRTLVSRLDSDVLAFQEVSGENAVREILPNQGADYFLCAQKSGKVQRLVLAWRKHLGPAFECAEEHALSLPHLPVEMQVRPGLSVGLTLGQQKIRLLLVHLKASCVSPLESPRNPNGRGQLAGNEESCQRLQQQIAPLEKWLEEKSQQVAGVILLGDINRNLWHESTLDGPEKNVQGKVTNLLREVNDGTPASSRLQLLSASCPVDATTEYLCAQSKHQVLSAQEMHKLTSPTGLGCRNAIGLDHILVSKLFTPRLTQKIPLGLFGRTQTANTNKSNPKVERNEPLLAVSDHCPLQTKLRVNPAPLPQK